MLTRHHRYIEILVPLALLFLIAGLLLEPYTSSAVGEVLRGLMIGLAIAMNVAYITIQAELSGQRDRQP
jgi:hypothetical protein